MAQEFLLYGSYGYTGSLIAQQAVDRDLTPVLAGRHAEKVEAQATDLGLAHRTFSLEQPTVVTSMVEQFDAVLNCAGPFSRTAHPLIDACLAAGTDYLDITGEVTVLEEIADRDADATDAGTTLLPAVGFDVVPSDCLAVHLASQVADPTRLRLALHGLSTFSPGTLKSVLQGATMPGAIRENGVIRTVPAAWQSRAFTFPGSELVAITVPWGDVSTAYHSTGIPTIQTYATVPEFARWVLERTRWLTPVVRAAPVQRALHALIDATVSGPTAAEREQNVVRIVGEVETESGDGAAAELRTPDPYDTTAMTAVESVRRVLDDQVAVGFQTPGLAFGPDFVLEFPGVERRLFDEPGSERPPTAANP
ncbi:saccharopine dehydrogenase NADP-binding domain-containing protein [Haloarculaceae archaeon H-GB11]|nr:saccharopine dehydrogenase NADP-binding domain-containing protein [Haloarculaceae archaeon H-GB11]